MAIEPHPAPTSQRSSPGSGANAANVAARTSRLVSCPSFSKASSGRPAKRERGRACGPGRHSMASVLRLATRPKGQVGAVPSMRRSRSPPICAKTVTALGPQPASARSFAACTGVSPSVVSARRRAPGARWSRSASIGRPCSAKRDAILERPDEPRRGEAEGARLRQHDHLGGREMAGERGADAIAQRIAARQHDNGLAAPRRDERDRIGQRLAPGQTLALGLADERQMPLAADHQLGRVDQGARRRRERRARPSSLMPMTASQAVMAPLPPARSPLRPRARCRRAGPKAR